MNEHVLVELIARGADIDRLYGEDAWLFADDGPPPATGLMQLLPESFEEYREPS